MNVFDFDNTIYDGESSVDFFFYFLKISVIMDVKQVAISRS